MQRTRFLFNIPEHGYFAIISNIGMMDDIPLKYKATHES